MSEESSRDNYAEQIAGIVRNFVQVWIKFESIVHGELLELQNRHGESNNFREEPHSNAIVELFFRISSCIHLLDNPTMGELSSALLLPFSTATRIVDYLVSRGYVQRLPDITDRRVVRVTLTAEGDEIHQFIESCTAERVKQMLSCLDIGERNTLFALIDKIAKSLEGTSK
jgi:DNA-binding MarR family transcriptional regulator